jgi:hypothetical protein
MTRQALSIGRRTRSTTAFLLRHGATVVLVVVHRNTRRVLWKHQRYLAVQSSASRSPLNHNKSTQSTTALSSHESSSLKNFSYEPLNWIIQHFSGWLDWQVWLLTSAKKNPKNKWWNMQFHFSMQFVNCMTDSLMQLPKISQLVLPPILHGFFWNFIVAKLW